MGQMKEINDALFKVRRYYLLKRYEKASIPTLLLGLIEEVGELSQAVLLKHCDDFTPRKGKEGGDNIPHEVGDCLTYLLAIAYKTGLPEFEWYEEPPND